MHRARFAAGIAVAMALGVWLAHGALSDARRDLAERAQERRAVVALQALALQPEQVQKWLAANPGIAQVRIARGMQLLFSTADPSAPRRLLRDEKPLYDRAQRLAGAVQTNRDEGARKAEIETTWLDGHRLSLAAPLDGSGIVEIETEALPPPPAAPWGGLLAAALAALAAFAIAAWFAGERPAILGVASVVALGAALLVIGRASLATLESDRRAGEAAVAEQVSRESALLASPAPLDVDEFRRPLPPLEAEAALRPLRRSLFGDAAVSLLVLLLAGLGALSQAGRALRKHRQAYAYIAPAIVGMLLLVFYPFAYGITLSFTDSNIYNTAKPISEIWIGLRNYAEILGQFGFARRTETGGWVLNYLNFYWTLLFTIIWTVCNVAFGVASGLFLALILNTRGLALRPIYRVVLILPWAMPTYITALIWRGMFHRQFGVINQLLQAAGLGAVSWFDHPFTSFMAAWTTNAWLSFPFMMVVSLGALQSIPADLYEAAQVDGATRWQQFMAITLPSLRPALVPAVIISVIWTFNQFNVIYLVTGGDPGGSTEILITQAFKFAFERYRYGYAAAYSTVIFGILLVYGMIQNRLSKATEA